MQHKRALKKQGAELEERSVERIPLLPTLTFQNLIPSFPVAKGMTDKVW